MDWERLPVAPLYADVRAYCSHINVYCKKKKALYLSVNVFSTKALIGDTTFTSPTGDVSAILRGHPSHAKVQPLRQYLQLSVIFKTLSIYLLLVSWVEESLKHHHWLYGRLSRTHYPDIFMTTCSRYCPLSIFPSWWDVILRLPCRRQNSRREKLGYKHLAEKRDYWCLGEIRHRTSAIFRPQNRSFR